MGGAAARHAAPFDLYLPIPITPGQDTSLQGWVHAEKWLSPLLPASLAVSQFDVEGAIPRLRDRPIAP